MNTSYMVTVEEAQKFVLEQIRSINAEEISLPECLGRTIARDYYSQDNIPPFDNSAMDGYAVSSPDVARASRESPVVLKVVEDLPAGSVAQREIRKGETARIMTGAAIPDGADTVIRVEKTRSEGRTVTIFGSIEAGKNIRLCGEDIRNGQLVLKKGTVVGPAEMGILASLGVDPVAAARPPTVGILATGDELVEIKEELTPSKIRNSNTYSLIGQVKESGGIPRNLGIAGDSKNEIRRKIEEGLKNDILIVSGGVSVGDYDYVKEVMTDLKGRIVFWKAAIKPGRPMVFAIINGRPVFGLPGNPAASMVSFEVFVRPAILKTLGRQNDNRREVSAVVEEEIKKKKGLRYFLRAHTRWEGGVYFTRKTGLQGSGILKSMVLANSLIVLPEEEEIIDKGRRVTVRFLN